MVWPMLVRRPRSCSRPGVGIRQARLAQFGGNSRTGTARGCANCARSSLARRSAAVKRKTGKTVAAGRNVDWTAGEIRLGAVSSLSGPQPGSDATCPRVVSHGGRAWQGAGSGGRLPARLGEAVSVEAQIRQ